jgi:hypothetical protein
MTTPSSSDDEQHGPQSGNAATEWDNLNQKLRALEQRQREMDKILEALGLGWVIKQLDAPTLS